MVAPLSPTPRAVLFDLDGTLADSMPSIAAALVETLAAFGHDTTVERVMPAFGPSMQKIIRRVAPVSEEEADAIYQAYLPTYYERYMPGTKPLPGAEALLDTLVMQGTALAIVTSKIEVGARAFLDQLGWGERFACVVGRDTSPAIKPAPEPALHALAALDVPASESAFVGDTTEDMECARAAGVATIVALAAEHDRDRLRAAGATHVCRSLTKIQRLLTAPQTGRDGADSAPASGA